MVLPVIFTAAAGKNIANPVATILSAAMMFEYAFDLQAEGSIIRKAVDASLDAKVVTVDISTEKPYSTSDVGDWIAEWPQLVTAALATCKAFDAPLPEWLKTAGTARAGAP